jgi:PAS domain S-box-containing protein
MKKIPLPADIVSQVLNTAADATIISDSAGYIRVVNERAEALFGYDPGELVGQQVEILLPDEFRNRHRELRNSYCEAPRSRPMQGWQRISRGDSAESDRNRGRVDRHQHDTRDQQPRRLRGVFQDAA